jgi:hypothetical protein
LPIEQPTMSALVNLKSAKILGLTTPQLLLLLAATARQFDPLNVCF